MSSIEVGVSGGFEILGPCPDSGTKQAFGLSLQNLSGMHGSPRMVREQANSKEARAVRRSWPNGKLDRAPMGTEAGGSPSKGDRPYPVMRLALAATRATGDALVLVALGQQKPVSDENQREHARKGAPSQREAFQAEPQERQRDGTSPCGFGRRKTLRA